MTVPEPRIGATPTLANDDFPWDSFDSHAYFAHNYSRLRDDDSTIIDHVAAFFQKNEIPHRLRRRAIDIGAGTNLYPALTMLPFAAEVSLCERSMRNRHWLEKEMPKPHPSWWEFWTRMASGRVAYAAIDDPLVLLHRRASVVKGDIFNLRPGQFDLGTMFFVAESITTDCGEFVMATQSFVNSLVPGAPFAAAFMRRSSGYQVGNRQFPSCPVDEGDVEHTLAPVATGVSILPVDSRGLRKGYHGMMVATGHKRA